MRLETVFFVLAALMGLVWFQRHGFRLHALVLRNTQPSARLCDELLWVRKQEFEGRDISSLLSDERGRRLLVEVLNKENINPSTSGHSMLLPGAGRWMAERAQVASGNNCKRILWFMGLRAEAAAQFEYYRYLQVALLSARKAAPSLIPYLVFDGAPNEVTAWFERQGGRVILHELTISETLKRAVEAGQQPPMWYRNRGAFLRLDVPFVFPRALAEYANDPTVEKDYFLYTDNDVLFLKDVNTCSFTPPPLFTIGPEHDKGKADNTGVMYVNASAFAAMREPLLEWGISKKWQFGAMDQGLILDYMFAHNLSIPVLPDTLNWKGYWGGNDEVAIVHFHGPKPERCLPCLLSFPTTYWDNCNVTDSCPNVYKYLFDKCSDRGVFFKQVLQEYHTLRYTAEHS